jgi:hypothetical protein
MLPGEKEAKELGFSLHCYSGDRRAATYIKDNSKPCIFLDAVFKPDNSVDYTLTGFFDGLLTVSCGPFSLPNKNFSIFEKKMMKCLQGSNS